MFRCALELTLEPSQAVAFRRVAYVDKVEPTKTRETGMAISGLLAVISQSYRIPSVDHLGYEPATFEFQIPEWLQLAPNLRTSLPEGTFGTLNRLIGMLTVASEELEDCPFYMQVDQLASVIRTSPPKMTELRFVLLSYNPYIVLNLLGRALRRSARLCGYQQPRFEGDCLTDEIVYPGFDNTVCSLSYRYSQLFLFDRRYERCPLCALQLDGRGDGDLRTNIVSDISAFSIALTPAPALFAYVYQAGLSRLCCHRVDECTIYLPRRNRTGICLPFPEETSSQQGGGSGGDHIEAVAYRAVEFLLIGRSEFGDRDVCEKLGDVYQHIYHTVKVKVFDVASEFERMSIASWCQLTLSAFLNAGYRVSFSHAATASLKTDAPPSFIWDVMCAWKRRVEVAKATAASEPSDSARPSPQKTAEEEEAKTITLEDSGTDDEMRTKRPDVDGRAVVEQKAAKRKSQGKKHPPSEAALRVEATLMERPHNPRVDFTPHPNANPSSRVEGLLR
ncbi:unnamed protein product [Schistocephalus solidus]|uniref:tRNA (guanine(26)-N(2))-dimethyltransferase n=1 Tax=Schistocephalus solidus TaxID=70667 RepID=A0A183SH78_SCHSO|nr:unnamed protein product [Schistocephalus solidus]